MRFWALCFNNNLEEEEKRWKKEKWNWFLFSTRYMCVCDVCKMAQKDNQCDHRLNLCSEIFFVLKLSVAFAPNQSSFTGQRWMCEGCGHILKKKKKKQIWVEAEGRNWPLSFLTVWMVLLLSHGFPKQRLEVRRRRQQMIVKRLSSAALVQGRDKMGADWVHCLDTQMTRRWLRKDEKEMH